MFRHPSLPDNIVTRLEGPRAELQAAVIRGTSGCSLQVQGLKALRSTLLQIPCTGGSTRRTAGEHQGEHREHHRELPREHREHGGRKGRGGMGSTVGQHGEHYANPIPTAGPQVPP